MASSALLASSRLLLRAYVFVYCFKLLGLGFVFSC
jgi:hypothetical protein